MTDNILHHIERQRDVVLDLENIPLQSTSVFKGSSQTASIRRIKTALYEVIATQSTPKRQDILARIVRWIWPGFRWA